MLELNLPKKIFLILLGVFILLILAIVISPTIYFEDYYVSKKIEDITVDLDKLSHKIENGHLDETQIYTLLDDYSVSNNVYVDLVSNSSFLDSKALDYTLDIYNPRYGLVDIYFNKYTLFSKEFYDVTKLEESSTVYIKGYLIDENTICPIMINLYRVDEKIYELYNITFDEDKYVSMIGTIKELSLPKKTGGEQYKSQIVWKMISDPSLSDSTKQLKEDLVLYKARDIDTNTTNYVLVKNTSDYMIISLISLQPLNDVLAYISTYMRYIVLWGILFMILFALIISRLITKPLLSINRAAKKMADLDFTEKLPIKSRDEIGVLSNSLNTMSEKLESTLYDLGDVNSKLKVELQKEKQLEEMRRHFIADSSHELKTPLGIISSYTERLQDKLLLETSDKAYMTNCTMIILDESRKMDKLIVDMNELSKLESHTYKINPTTFDLIELTSNVLHKFELLIETHELKLKTRFYEHPLLITADMRRIEQVLTNFIINAIRYSPEKGYILVCVDYDEHGHIFFSIENNCEHFSQDDFEKLWDRFYRVDKSRSRKSGGSGLGLAIVKIILELHDFEYGVESVQDGIRFYFSLK